MKLTEEQYKRADWLSINERKEQLAINKVILEQKIEEMQKTLEWYADENIYDFHSPFFNKPHIIIKDRGERARSCLKVVTNE